MTTLALANVAAHHQTALCARTKTIKSECGRLDALEGLATSTKAGRVVTQSLSTPGWESGGKKLRLLYDSVKRG